MTGLRKATELISEMDLDGILISKPENRLYISNFTGSTGYVLILKDTTYFLTDFRYIEQAQSQCSGIEVVEITKEKTLERFINSKKIANLGFEDLSLTYQQYTDLKSKLDNINLIPLGQSVNRLRIIKTEEEIENIRHAARITDNGFDYILPSIKPGAVENDLALELEFYMRRNGAEKNSFDFIVASGIRSSLPHGRASNKVVENGDLITFDFGCIYNGYCSDMTRTVAIGNANKKQKEIYNIVLEAQITALESVKPGLMGKEIDKTARDVISKYGYGEFFGHNLGHGVGLEVHEMPNLGPQGEIILEPGMIITIEPGIYIPNLGGVRIEDLVLVTETGYEVLSKSEKELIELNI